MSVKHIVYVVRNKRTLLEEWPSRSSTKFYRTLQGAKQRVRQLKTWYGYWKNKESGDEYEILEYNVQYEGPAAE
jgi:hypothetical protein